MEDRELHKRIAKLVAEERELEEGHIGTRVTAEQEQRLREVRAALDQSWDLLAAKAGRDGSSTRTSRPRAPDHRRSWRATNSRSGPGAVRSGREGAATPERWRRDRRGQR